MLKEKVGKILENFYNQAEHVSSFTINVMNKQLLKETTMKAY